MSSVFYGLVFFLPCKRVKRWQIERFLASYLLGYMVDSEQDLFPE